ncbi:hypothetical protein JS528_11325 [Bifidobacterium sp. MA2]|uniref:Uncharacterized protein n=1 Tax=Bifidobacterium santillanense TaxID=2809028 RepID=A0ABS5UTT4_9BIFI|nr:hypothetical protein [Bifidobacterium santillanense]MBT1173908.1 hypothetical protein [Bifidobacterium santillanense]
MTSTSIRTAVPSPLAVPPRRSASETRVVPSHAVSPLVPREAEGFVHVVRAGEVEQLVEFLGDPDRTLAAVVATRCGRPLRCRLNMQRVARDLRGVATVFELESVNATWEFCDALPEHAKVYNGFARLYPSGVAWLDDPDSLPNVYGGFTDDVISDRTESLIEDAIGMLAGDGYSTETPVAAAPGLTPATVRMEGTCGDRGLGRLFDGTLVSVKVPDDAVGVPADHVFADGQMVRGMLDPDSRVVSGVRMLDADRAIAGYVDGAIVLVRVDRVRRDYCMVSLYPGRTVCVDAKDALDGRFTPEDDLRTYVREGDVRPMTIITRGKGRNDWRMRFANSREALSRALPAPILVTGGVPWLQILDVRTQSDGVPNVHDLRRMLMHDETIEPSALVPSGADATSARVIRTLLELVDGEHRRGRRLQRKLDDARRQNESLRDYGQEQRRMRAHAGTQYRTMRGLFLDDADRVHAERDRFDAWIREAWALRFSAEDKARYPLPGKWSYCDDFFETMERTVIDRQDVVEAAVEVLVGLAAQSKSRDCHPLRVGAGGDNAVRLGPNGDPIYRIRLDQGASARRLHYTVGAGGFVTFLSVGVHDEDL